MERMTKEKMYDTMKKMAYFIDKKCSKDCNYDSCSINKLCDEIFNDDSTDGIAPCHKAGFDTIIKAFNEFDFDESDFELYKKEN